MSFTEIITIFIFKDERQDIYNIIIWKKKESNAHAFKLNFKIYKKKEYSKLID